MSYQGDLRRFRIPVDITLENLYSILESILKIDPSQLILRWRDDENDLIRFTSDIELEECLLLTQSFERSIIYLYISDAATERQKQQQQQQQEKPLDPGDVEVHLDIPMGLFSQIGDIARIVFELGQNAGVIEFIKQSGPQIIDVFKEAMEKITDIDLFTARLNSLLDTSPISEEAKERIMQIAPLIIEKASQLKLYGTDVFKQVQQNLLPHIMKIFGPQCCEGGRRRGGRRFMKRGKRCGGRCGQRCGRRGGHPFMHFAPFFQAFHQQFQQFQQQQQQPEEQQPEEDVFLNQQQQEEEIVEEEILIPPMEEKPEVEIKPEIEKEEDEIEKEEDEIEEEGNEIETIEIEEENEPEKEESNEEEEEESYDNEENVWDRFSKFIQEHRLNRSDSDQERESRTLDLIQKYAEQIHILSQLGLTDLEVNIAALEKYKGNVQAAANHILSRMSN